MLTNSAPENTLTKSDANGNLIASRVTDDGTDTNLKNLNGTTRIGDTQDEANGTVATISDVDKRVSIAVNPNGAENAHLLMESGGAFLQVTDGTRTVLISLSSAGAAQLGTNGGNNTKLWLDDAARQLVLQSLSVEPESDGVTQLGTSEKSFKRLFLDSAIVDIDDVPGDTTINKACGLVIFGAGMSSVTVTNDLVSPRSFVFAVVRTNDATAAIKNVTAHNGLFVIRLQAPATDATLVAFWVLN